MEYDAHGTLEGAIGTVQDITDLKKAKEALESERQLLQSIFDSIPVMLTLYEPSMDMLRLNRAIYDITGWTHDDVKKHGILDLAYPDPDYQKKILDYMKSLDPGFKDVLMVCKDGRIIETSWANIRIPDGRQVGIGIDISKRKHMEEKLRQHSRDLELANKELESFSYSVSHDLRNPLNTILAMATVLKEFYAEKLDKDGKRTIEEIERSSEQMAGIISNLLRLSRVSRQKIQRHTIDLSAMAAHVLDSLRKSQPHPVTDIRIQKNMKTRADAGLLHQALFNLLDNAWKYSSQKKKPVIEVGCYEQDSQTIYYVRDNGKGFDLSETDELFEPFFRLGSAAQFEGSGIGLSLVKRIISRHGGTIWAEAKKEKGATFYFTLS